MRPNVYGLLNRPFVYRLAGWVLAPGAGRLQKGPFARVFAESQGCVLDVGCGPRLNTPMPEGRIVGIDINAQYIRQYTGGVIDTDPDLAKGYQGPRKILGYVGSADELPFADGAFDEARSFGLLHHLPPAVAATAVREMFRCVRPGGRVVVVDNVWPRRPWLRPVAWLTRRLDRGEWVRTEAELTQLVEAACPARWSASRFTYTYTGLEALALVLTVPRALAAA